MQKKITGIQLFDSLDKEQVLDLKINPRHDEAGRIISGLVIGNTMKQNQALILIAHPGDFKHQPTLGVGLSDALLDENLLEFRHKIREHFAIDGMYVKHLDFYELQKLKIEAQYE